VLNAILTIAALPSYISVCTQSPRGSPRIVPGTIFNMTDIKSEVTLRLAKYATVPDPNHVLESREVREMFNDLQIILGCERNANNLRRGPWNPVVENDITQVRNLMNTIPQLAVKRGWVGR